MGGVELLGVVGIQIANFPCQKCPCLRRGVSQGSTLTALLAI